MAATHIRRVEPLATDWRRFVWSGGAFDTGRREHTPAVEGIIAVPHHLVLVTLTGGAGHLEVEAACGHRYRGEDFAGAVSFVPAGCERRLKMKDVRARWASISLRPELLDRLAAQRKIEVPTFTNVHDPFVASMAWEFFRLQERGGLDSGYCEAMSLALCRHLAYRYGNALQLPAARKVQLAAWQLRRITEYVDAHLDGPISVSALASLVGLSAGHFHRAMRAALGITPLEFINRRRIEKAQSLIMSGSCTVEQACAAVGFMSTSHFTRLFKRMVGVSPGRYRRGR